MGFAKVPDDLEFIMLCYMISALLMPLFLFLSVFFYVFRFLLAVYLKIRYGEKFIGLIKGGDSLWSLGKPNESTITILLAASLKNEELPTFIDGVKEKITTEILNKKEKIPKLTSSVHCLMGYGYLLRNNCKAEEIVSTIKIDENSDISSDELIGDISSRQLPFNNRFPWELVAIDAPTSWKIEQNISENHCMLVLRIHHIIGDGMSVATALVKIFSDKPVDFAKYAIESIKYSEPVKPPTYVRILLFLHQLMLTPGYIFLNKLFLSDAKNGEKIFEPSPLSSKKYVYTASDIDGSIMETVKRIKKNIGNATFIEIMLTALSKSLNNYFDKAEDQKPDILVQALPFITSMPNSSEYAELSNNISILRCPIPVIVNSESFTVRLNKVKEYLRNSRNIIDTQVRQFGWNHLAGLWPGHVILPSEKWETAMIVSNIPGCPRFTSVGHEMEHIYFYPPQVKAIGMFCTFFTYDNKLQICITINESALKSRIHYKNIANDIIDAIKNFDEQISNKVM
ncbi:unnamed protein product [Phyllotreta striolata]|uniref:O-acyltransferase WSD1 C-terminal domain-containing protein n=1 Tax=Phyllotreta striolata TaxID=444603 RepID=A0A9N9TPJ0_PHYSR|nr:unnamed protein product [Phyllotreta striolata]